MGRKAFLVFIALNACLLGLSQEPAQDSIVPKKANLGPALPVDSFFVSYTHFRFDSIFLNPTQVIDTTTFNAPVFDDLEKERTFYSTLSNTGLAHKSMRFRNLRGTGFDMNIPAFDAYFHDDRNMVCYQSVLPYSEIRYVMTSGDKEQHLRFRFGRQVWSRLFVSFAITSDMSPGVFKNNKSENNSIWINAHYFTENQRYAASAYFFRNKLEMQENGGIVNDEVYTSHAESDNSVIPTNLSDATNYVRTTGFGLEHYFNLLPQKTQKKVEKPLPRPVIDSLPVDSLQVDSLQTDTLQIDTLLMDSLRIDTLRMDTLQMDTIRMANSMIAQDSITDTVKVEITTKTRKFTLGRISHQFSFQRNRLYYNETSPTAAFYQPYDTLLNTSKTTDSTVVQAIRNTLKWNSLGYQKYNDDVPFYLYAGLTHGFYRVLRYDYAEEETFPVRNYQQLSVNGGVIVNLFHSTRITGHGELVTLGYHIGDFDVRGQWKQFLGTTERNLGAAIFNVEVKRQSASWFEESYSSNHFRWDNHFRASTYLTFDLRYTFRTYCVGVKQTSIAQYIYFGTDARPTQYDGMFSIREAYLNFNQKLWRFEFEGFASLQKASNEDVMHLPLVMGKLKIAYSQPIFKKAATLQPMLTVSYFTKYHADAYMPATRSFFLQNEVEIGNYPFIDLAIALKVQRANVFVSYSNMMLLLGNYEGFVAPHYPMRDSKFFFGVNWRLFN